MSDLIKREDAIEVAYQLRRKPNDEEWDWWLRSFNAIPSADRPQGEWMPIIEANEFGEAYQVGIYCSECGETLGCEANFCPNCGARMKGAIDGNK